MLLPKAIAVVGATDRPRSIGAALWENVTAAASVPVYAVSRTRRVLGDTPVYARIVDIPAVISLAVIAVPAAALDETIDDCIAAHVRGAVVVTSVDGTDVDVDAMVVRARNNGMRIIGPSSMGVAASERLIGLDASLLPERLSEGRVAISMQSGSLGASFLELVKQQALGLSWFVSLGDRADVSGTDMLQFFEDDESTLVIGMYTEDLGDPRRFARIARRVSKHRPIVAVRTSAELGPTNSALYRHCGLIEVPTVAALLDTVRVLATQPVLHGDRIAVLSNYPSPERLARRAITARGLRAVEPPIQLDFRASPADYTKAIEATLNSDDIDGLLVVHAPPLAEAVGGPVVEIDRAAHRADKPIVAVLLATADGPIAPESNVPNFMFPEPAAAVLGRSWAYGRWLATEAASPPAVVEGVDVDQVSDLVAAALLEGATRLDPAAIAELLTAYGIRVPPTRFVAAADAVRAASEVGFPVAVKARHRHVGRSLRAGVALDLTDGADVQVSIDVMRAELGDDADFVIVQPMVAPGLDLRIQARIDEEAGTLISTGTGGIQAGLVGDDDPVRVAPLSRHSAAGLVSESRAGPQLTQAGLDPAALVDTLIRAAQLAADHAEITALDFNPVITSEAGCAVTDAVVEVAPVGRPAGALRRL
jgi:acyl-CoA synthetase (NDP forming)